MKKPVKPILVGASLLGLGAVGVAFFSNRVSEAKRAQGVYGPPSYFGAQEEPTEPAVTSNVVQEDPEDVYGPPVEDFDENPIEEEPETVYGPPSYFDVEENEDEGGDVGKLEESPQLVYGPPSYFGIKEGFTAWMAKSEQDFGK